MDRQLASPAEKKRIRDQRAQQALRDKRLRHTRRSEDQVAHCQRYHNDQSLQQLLQVIRGLQKQNEALLVRQERLKCLINSWDVEDVEPLETIDVNASGGNESREGVLREINGLNGHGDVFSSSHLSDQFLRAQLDYHPRDLTGPHTAHLPISSFSFRRCDPAGTDTNLPWNILPLNDDDFSSASSISCPWLMYPEQVASAADTPFSPLDFLYGTKTHHLADIIHKVSKRRPLRDPERLAIGWVMYHFSKWVMSPSPASFSKLPVFMRPVMDQIQIMHLMVFDTFPGPQVRLNLIRRWHVYRHKSEDLFGLAACCFKIRWPWGEEVLERNANNELRMKQTFYDTFMSVSGWGLTPEFIRKYPDLFSRVDIASIVYEVA